MNKPTFEEIQARPERSEQLHARARRARARMMGTLARSALRRILRWLWPQGDSRAARPAAPAVSVRAAGTGDRERIQELVRGLSPASRYLRFFGGIRELPSQWLDRFTRSASETELTLLALVRVGGTEILVGMAQYAAAPERSRGEFAVLVTDAWQGKGIGKRLIREVACIARAAGLARLDCEVLVENGRMLRMARSVGIAFEHDPETPYALRASLAVADPRWRCGATPAGAVVPALQA